MRRKGRKPNITTRLIKAYLATVSIDEDSAKTWAECAIENIDYILYDNIYDMAEIARDYVDRGEITSDELDNYKSLDFHKVANEEYLDIDYDMLGKDLTMEIYVYVDEYGTIVINN